MKFKYKDEVTIINGFYEGYGGTVIDTYRHLYPVDVGRLSKVL